MVELRREAIAQKTLKAEQTALRGDNFKQTVAEVLCMTAPDVLKRNALVAEEMSGVGCEGCEASRCEDEADEVGHVGGIDDLINRTGSDDQRVRHAAIETIFRAVEKEISGEVEDDLGASRGQDSLAL